MSETTTAAPPADAIPNILQPASVPIPGSETKPDPAQPPAAAAEPPKEVSSEEDAQEKKPSRASERISELYGKAKAAERLAEARAREVQELRKQLGELQQQPADPADFAAQNRNDVRAAVKEERLHEAYREAQAHAAEAQQLRYQGFNARIEAARERIPDIDNALREFAQLPVSEVAADIIGESEKAAEIAYYLSKNPDEARDLARLPNHKQAYRLAQIEAKVSKAEPRRTSSAPPPPPMIGATSSPSAPALKDMGVADIAKLLGYGA